MLVMALCAVVLSGWLLEAPGRVPAAERILEVPARGTRLVELASVAVTTTTIAATTTTAASTNLPSDGPLRYPWSVFELLAILAGTAVVIVVIVGMLVYLFVKRTRRGGPPATRV